MLEKHDRWIGQAGSQNKTIAVLHIRRHCQSQTDSHRMAANLEGRREQLSYREGFDRSQSIALTTAMLALHPSAWK